MGLIAALKSLHILGLVCWCAALIGLPLLLHSHRVARRQRQFTEYRLVTHVGYTAFATPAALIAIAAGTALILLDQVFAPWLLLKLVFVAAMVMVHVWIGHLIQQSGEERRINWWLSPIVGLVLALIFMTAVLVLVLLKPDAELLGGLVPRQLWSPLEVAP